MTALAAALKEGGANFFVYLPDVILFKTYAALAADRDVQTFQCSREDRARTRASPWPPARTSPASCRWR
jgi:hypothetical protein